MKFTQHLLLNNFLNNIELTQIIIIVAALLLVTILCVLIIVFKKKKRKIENSSNALAENTLKIEEDNQNTDNIDNYELVENIEDDKTVEDNNIEKNNPVEDNNIKKDIPVKDNNIDKNKSANNKEANKYSGKYEIEISAIGYCFYLIASNGQLLFASNGFTTPEGAIKGIETFKTAVQEGDFVVDEDKFGRFRFILNKRYAGENFTTKYACESNIESVKKFAFNAEIIDYKENPEGEKEYDKIRKSKFVTNCDWEKIEQEEAQTKPSGKFEITEHKDGFRFELIANNGQLLYSSNGYAGSNNAKEAINNFKKSVYCGTFIVDGDKFGRYRFVLRGANYRATYIGESYTTKAAAERSIESVKNFVKSAVMPD